MLDTLLSGACQGLIWAVLALGVFISYRLLNFADLSCEGSITCGASVAAMLIWKGVSPFLTVLLAFLAGCIAGAVTGLLHTKLKIPPILAGILTMISLYSINIHIMSFATGKTGTANLSLLKFKESTVYALTNKGLHFGRIYTSLLLGFVIAGLFVAVLYWFFGTELGCTIRATGNNERMCRAQGINTDFTKVLGLALSNGLIAVSGALLAQYQNYADVNMGVGSIVIGLASIIIGEALCAKLTGFVAKLTGIVVGSVIYRMVVAVVIYSGMPSADLKIMTAVIVVVALSLPQMKALFAGHHGSKQSKEEPDEQGRDAA